MVKRDAGNAFLDFLWKLPSNQYGNCTNTWIFLNNFKRQGVFLSSSLDSLLSHAFSYVFNGSLARFVQGLWPIIAGHKSGRRGTEGGCNLPWVRIWTLGWEKARCVERKASTKSGRERRNESNNTMKNIAKWVRMMFTMLLCASSWRYHLFSLISREWELGCSTKVTVYASCRGGLFIVS